MPNAHHNFTASEVKNSMSVPPLRLGNNFDSYISGEVIIHPSAVIAPGVILQAAPNSKIIIGSGVCIGMGSILKVHQGTLEVEAGANLGAGFLMIGEGKIGANACIGAATTVFNCSVKPGQVVAPGSVLGDTSRHISDSVDTTDQIQQPEPSTTNSDSASIQEDRSPQEQADTGNSHVDISASSATEGIKEPTTDSPNNIGTHIYGQGSIQQLLITLFPHRQSLNKPPSDEQSE
jgi:carbon dioxide concentrating mechanism protein CcmN